MLKHFSIIEVQSDSDTFNVGVITNIINNSIGMESFKERLISALQEHFDCDEITFVSGLDELPNLFKNEPYVEIKMTMDWDEGLQYVVRLYETWLY